MINKQVHYTLSPFYFGIITFIAAMMLLLLKPSIFNFESYTVFDIAMFLLSGIFNYIGQATKSLALKLGSASFVASFNYIQVVMLIVCDLLLFGYTFGWMDYLGVLITFTFVIFPVIQKLSDSRKVLLKI